MPDEKWYNSELNSENSQKFVIFVSIETLRCVWDISFDIWDFLTKMFSRWVLSGCELTTTVFFLFSFCFLTVFLTVFWLFAYCFLTVFWRFSDCFLTVFSRFSDCFSDGFSDCFPTVFSRFSHGFLTVFSLFSDWFSVTVSDFFNFRIRNSV